MNYLMLYFGLSLIVFGLMGELIVNRIKGKFVREVLEDERQ